MLDFFGISAGQTWQPGSSLTMADRGMRTRIIITESRVTQIRGQDERVVWYQGDGWIILAAESGAQKGCMFRICWTIRGEKLIMTDIAGQELPAPFHLWKLWFASPFSAGKHTSVEKAILYIAIKVCSYCKQQSSVQMLTLDSYLT